MQNLLENVRYGVTPVKDATNIVAPFVALAMLVRDNTEVPTHLQRLAEDALARVNAPDMTLEQAALVVSFENGGHSRKCSEAIVLHGESCSCRSARIDTVRLRG